MKVGDRVEFIKGSWIGHQGVIESINDAWIERYGFLGLKEKFHNESFNVRLDDLSRHGNVQHVDRVPGYKLQVLENSADYSKLDKILLTQSILRNPKNKFGYQPNSLWYDEDGNELIETHIWIWGEGPDGIHDDDRDPSFFLLEVSKESEYNYYFRISPGDAVVKISTAGDLQRLMDIFRIGRKLIIE